jgi:hypothetical protein
VLTLALGIGATTAIFSTVYALLIHPLPYYNPDRLVWITEQQRSGIGGAIAEPDMVSWRERGRLFEAVAGYAFNEYTLTATAGSLRLQGVEHPAEPEIYVPFAQAPRANFHVVLATNGNPGALSAPLRSTIFALNHQAPVYDIATLEQRLSESLAQRRLTMLLLSAFAALALLLAAVGVYGVISCAVVRRTQEIGIRVALGGTRQGVLRRQQARLILADSVLGLALASALSGVMSSLLYGVKAHDFTTFALSWIVLMIVAVLAGAAPTVRATRIDPCVALRNE